MTQHAPREKIGMLLEAEVAPGSQTRFENRYMRATGCAVSPGNPDHYQDQSGKWGAELRVYFNNPLLASLLEKRGFHVERGRRGYRSGEYRYRINNNNLWWELVESHGLRLGEN